MYQSKTSIDHQSCINSSVLTEFVLAKVSLLSETAEVMGQQCSVLQVCLLTVVAVLAAGLFLVTRLKARKRLPPGPTPWPVVGNLRLLGELPHHSLAKLAKEYGPLMSLRLGSRNCVVVSSPKYAEEFLKANDLVWASRPVCSQGELLCFQSSDIGMSPYGPHWRYARKIFTLELLTAKRLADFQKSRRKEILSAVNAFLDKSGGENAVRMDLIVNKMALDIVAKMLMNERNLSDRASAMIDDDDLSEAIKESFVLLGAFNVGDFIPWLDRFDLQGYRKRMIATAKKLDEFLQGIIDDHREMHTNMETHHKESKVEDIVDVMLSRPRDDDGQNLTELEMKGIMQDAMFGGSDTSANTIEWGLSELIKNPRILLKAQEEIDSMVGRERIVEESDVPNLPYLKAVVKEIFRLHPVAPLMIPHESTENCTIGGYDFPAGTRLYVNAYAIQRDPDVWERPLEFYPERFLNQTKDVMGVDFDLLPFGSGRRMCPGKNLGLLTVHTTLAVLIHACNWRLPGGQKPEDLEMLEIFGLTVRRKNPLQVIAVPRLPRHVISTK